MILSSSIRRSTSPSGFSLSSITTNQKNRFIQYHFHYLNTGQVNQVVGCRTQYSKGDHFEVLLTLVEAYEEKYYPILLPDQ